ncbi:MAG: NAD-binding protein [Marinilabiliales bacterium]|nr:NAD-binding protein [Marinilabiliales bacterium]
MVRTMELPFTSIIFDTDRARKEMEKGNLVVFGDATYEPVLRQAYVHTAEMVILFSGRPHNGDVSCGTYQDNEQTCTHNCPHKACH